MLAGLRVVQSGGGAARFAGWALAELGADVLLVGPSAAPGHPEAWLDAAKHRWQGALADALDLADAWLCGPPTEGSLSWAELDGLARMHPNLPIVFGSPFGRFGPLAKWRGDDLTAQAISSLISTLGAPGRPPLPLPFEQGDYLAGVHAAGALLGLLLGLGEPGPRDVATADVLAYVTGMAASTQGNNPDRFHRGGLPLNRGIYPTGVYRCRDGHVLIASNEQHQWDRLRQLIGVPDAPEPADRARRRAWRDEYLARWLSKFCRADLLKLALREGLTLAPINHVGELPGTAHFGVRPFFRPLDGVWATSAPFLIDDRRPEPVQRGARAPGSDWRPLRSTGPLRVVDLSWNWAGALVGQMLAECGAEVIRVESRARLENLRKNATLSLAFRNANRGKLSLTLNLKTERGRELLCSLIAQSDVLLESFSPGTLERIGLGEAELRGLKPDLIVLSSTVAGQVGPWSALHGFAAITQALSGLEALVGYPGEPPGGYLLMSGHADFSAAAWGSVAVLAALMRRVRTGQGARLDLSQLEAVVAGLGTPLALESAAGRPLEPPGPVGIHRAAGPDAWIAIAAEPGSAIEADSPPVELAASLQAASVAAAPVLDILAQQQQPHFRARGLLIRADDPVWGKALLYRPVWLHPSGARPSGSDAPQLGEHSAPILTHRLGLSEDEIAHLTATEVVW